MKLGDKLRDTLTGFVGTATAHIQYLHGSPQWQLTALVDGQPIMEWVEESRLQTVAAGVKV